jgi:hypothetical protein
MVINMKKHALVNSENIVENVILWDGSSEWTAPQGKTLIDVENVMCGIGWIHSNGTFTEPPTQVDQPVAEVNKEQLMAELAALTAKIQALE